jgi:hypothetical protein
VRGLPEDGQFQNRLKREVRLCSCQIVYAYQSR